MENQIKLNRSDENKLYLLGAYQIGGGIYGAILTFFMLGNFNTYPIGKIMIVVLGIALFLYSAFCGYLLITRRFLKGLNLSIYNNALQIIGFGAAGYHFKFVSGFFTGLTLDLTDDTFIGFGFDFSIITLAFASKSELIFMTINIFAILVLGFVFKIRNKIEQKIKSYSDTNIAETTMHKNL